MLNSTSASISSDKELMLKTLALKPLTIRHYPLLLSHQHSTTVFLETYPLKLSVYIE